MNGTDRSSKREAVLALMVERGAQSLLLTGTAVLGWYLDGARVHIALSAGPILSVRVTSACDEVYLTSNEAGRMLLEELPADVIVRSREWHEPLTVEADLAEAEIEGELRDLRRTLSSVEIERFSALGADAASVLTDALTAATPTMTGFELASLVAAGIVARGADPLVVLVGGESRVSVRHPLPTLEPLGRRAMLVVCSRRHGLIANATRWVRFGAASAEEQDADARILEVEADTFAETRPGAALRDILAGIQRSYPAHGFANEEWLGHHQGGAAGYETRDPLATPGAGDVVALGQAFAWNPTAPGTKVEDTVVVTSEGLRVLTVDPRWPTTMVRGLARPAVLER
ncbi:MAG: peptidase [Microbacteriaceae bacterium]|jgi:Xaa-Pro aminopeptidase|nr:peptidase [Microbacteriaceae bacterium]HEV7956672.1 M24 family metallopeptidase [Marisediminicola sp.]